MSGTTCTVDTDCPGDTCGSQVCSWATTPHMCVPAGSAPSRSSTPRVTSSSRSSPPAALNGPWALAVAPTSPPFGALPGGSLLVGNFSDGVIHAYNPTTGAPVATLSDSAGVPIAIDGLWALTFGPGGARLPATHQLFFSAGADGEANGVIGRLDAM